MAYHYTDESRASDPHALPDVEVFHSTCYPAERPDVDDARPRYGVGFETLGEIGFYYAHGSPGCLWDSDPAGPFDTEAEALAGARETAGFCEHGIGNDGATEIDGCVDCHSHKVLGG